MYTPHELNKDINITNAILLRCMCTHNGILSSPSTILKIFITMLYKTKHTHMYGNLQYMYVYNFGVHNFMSTIYIFFFFFVKLCLQIIVTLIYFDEAMLFELYFFFYIHLFFKDTSSNRIYIYILFYIITHAL